MISIRLVLGAIVYLQAAAGQAAGGGGGADGAGAAMDLETVKMNLLPLPTSDSTQMSPLCSSTVILHMARPRPKPMLLCSSICEYFSKISLRLFSGMPGPVSSTAKKTFSLSSQVERVMLPPPGVNLSELPIRLVMTRSSRPGSAVTMIGDGGGATESFMFL